MGTGFETIIMVDDDITNLTIARNNLAGQYNIFTAPSGDKLFVLLEKVLPSLILLDIEMPDMDGFRVMEKLKRKEKTAHIPVIFLTAKIDPESEIKGFNLGAVDYITKPFSKELLIKRIDLHIMFERQKKELLKYNLSLESEVDKKARIVMELQTAILKTVAELVECRDNVTGGHIERTQHYLGLLTGFLMEHGVYKEEISTWDVDLFVMSSQLHDVGKISIRDEILMKPGKLTNEEFEEMKKHTTKGVDIIRKIENSTTESEFLLYAEILAGSHHEKWNGKGYPFGLKGTEIPLQGRLMAIVDVYDALTDERPYKEAFSHEKSIGIIKEERGEHFDPLITDVFLTHEKEFNNVETQFNNTGIKRKVSTKPNDKLHPTLRVVANFFGERGGKEQGHVDRMRAYLEILYKAMLKHERYKKETSSWDADIFLMSAQLHDIGKIAVPDHILNKERELTKEEFESIKTHTDFGVKIIRQVKENVGNGTILHHAELLAGSHHEKWDGSGYPHGLKGEGIPLQGRMMAIVDVYDALTTDRPHRKKKTHKEAVEIIMNSAGTQFDPNLVDVFLECESEFEKVEVELVEVG